MNEPNLITSVIDEAVERTMLLVTTWAANDDETGRQEAIEELKRQLIEKYTAPDQTMNWMQKN